MPRKRHLGSKGLARSSGRNRVVRNLLIGVPVALAAIGLVVLAVYGCLRLRDRANEDRQVLAKQQETGTAHGNVGIGGSGGADQNEVPGGDGSQGKGNSKEGPDQKENTSDSDKMNLANTENTPEPLSYPSASPTPEPTPESTPEPTPEPTTNGHEFDNEMVIVIDAGHGGYDGGSVVGDVVEKNVNLAVAQEIARILEEHGGITVVQTRVSDDYVSKQDRCDIANAAKCDYFVSVHCNTYEDDASVRGFECHYNEKSSEGAKFAESVSGEMKQYKDMKIRSTKPNNLAVTVHTYAPAILIEMGFLTNSTDRANLTDSDYQKQLAERIAKAVLKTAGL